MRWINFACWCAAIAVPTAPAPAAEAADLASILQNVAPSIVTVKVVIKTEVVMMGQAQNDESRSELQGVVVDGSGLVMISNAEISEDRMKDALAGNPMMSQIDFKITPSDFKVVFENEEKEYPAFLAAKDTTLDLAFLQVEELADRELVPVLFDDAPSPEIGDTLVVVSRLRKGYDYAPLVSTGRVSGVIRKPRRAWTVDGAISAYGLPVFAAGGEPVGVLVTLAPTVTEDAGASSFGSMMRLMRGGGLDTGPGTFVLPSTVVSGLVEQAVERSAELLSEEREEPEP